MTVEVRAEKGDESKPDRILGYAAVFGKDSVDLGGWTEDIAPGAFTETLKDDDIRALVDHDASMIIGRTSANTLRLAEDKVGLRMEIDLPETSVGRDIFESVSRGDVTGASFSFRTVDDQWTTKNEIPHRTLLKARLFDTGPVSFPAYPDTSVAVRSLEAWKKTQEPVVVVPDAVDDTDAEDRQRQAAATV